MRTRYSRIGNEGLLTGGRAALGAVVVIVVVLFLFRTFFPDTLVALMRPLVGTGDALSAAVGSVGLFEEKKAAQEELLREIEVLRAENAGLRAELGDLSKLPGDEGVRAGVVARPPASPYDSLVVAAGSSSGVSLGALAYGPGSVPIGTVARVSAASAHISLYSAPGRRTEGWAGEARIPVSIEGAGSGAFRAGVAKDAGLVVGDQVYVPGPGALPIGVVARIDTDASSPEATLFIRPLANPFTITWVVIAEAL